MLVLVECPLPAAVWRWPAAYAVRALVVHRYVDEGTEKAVQRAVYNETLLNLRVFSVYFSIVMAMALYLWLKFSAPWWLYAATALNASALYYEANALHSDIMKSKKCD